MSNTNKRLEILESKIQPESNTPVKVEYARDWVSLATRVRAAMMAMKLEITIEAITGREE